MPDSAAEWKKVMRGVELIEKAARVESLRFFPNVRPAMREINARRDQRSRRQLPRSDAHRLRQAA